MPAVLTTHSTVRCHQPGQVRVPIPISSKLRVGGLAVLPATITFPFIVNCPGTGANTIPCSKVGEVRRGPAAKLRVGGTPVLLDTLEGSTNGTPPGLLTAIAGQTRLTAI